MPKKKIAKQKSDIADETENIANVSGSMDNGGVIDLTSLQSSRDNLIIWEAMAHQLERFRVHFLV